MPNIMSVLDHPIAIGVCLAVLVATLIIENWGYWTRHRHVRWARYIAATIGAISVIASVTIASRVTNSGQANPAPVATIGGASTSAQPSSGRR